MVEFHRDHQPPFQHKRESAVFVGKSSGNAMALWLSQPHALVDKEDFHTLELVK